MNEYFRDLENKNRILREDITHFLSKNIKIDCDFQKFWEMIYELIENELAQERECNQ